MKNLSLLLFVIFIITSCQKDEKSLFTPKNYLEEFQTEEIQIFDLDTLSFKKITGKRGTEIYFSRNDFDISKNQKISLELIELYNFKKILYRNINTVTVNNELLETNGVLYISFKSKGKQVKLKKNKKVQVTPPEDKLNSYDIFRTKMDSLNNIKWKKTNQDYQVITENKGGGIFVDVYIHKDSIENYRKREKKRMKKRDSLTKLNSKIKNTFFITNEAFGFINIDRIVEIDTTLNFNLIDKTNQFSGFNIYITYKNLKSFIYNTRLKDDLKFKEIPISGKTWMTIIGEKNDGIYYDKIQLNKELKDSEIILKMKKTNIKELQKMLTN